MRLGSQRRTECARHVAYCFASLGKLIAAPFQKVLLREHQETPRTTDQQIPFVKMQNLNELVFLLLANVARVHTHALVVRAPRESSHAFFPITIVRPCHRLWSDDGTRATPASTRRGRGYKDLVEHDGKEKNNMPVPPWLVDRHNKANAHSHDLAQVAR